MGIYAFSHRRKEAEGAAEPEAGESHNH
jgi:hypothetical protein